MSNCEYKRLKPFKWFVLQNFPFIDEDFDAITNYELLCKVIEYLNKTIEKTNELGIQVEELNNWFNNLDVQDEIDNKLNEMAEDGTLAEIINQEILGEIQERIAEIETKIENNVEYHFIKTGNLQGDCILIKTENHAYLNDLSMSTNYLNIANYLTINNITHIDGIIISHFHYDHIGGSGAEGFLGLINSSFVDTTTQIYLPTTPDFTQFINDTATTESNVVGRVTAMMNAVINGANAKNLTINYMATNDTLEVDDVTFRFLNCSEEQYENYYDITQSFDDGLHYCTVYNNFSMVLEITNINNTTLLTGDIEEKAEEILSPFINKIIKLKKLEHHGVNQLSNDKYLIKTNAEINVVMNGTNDGDMTTMRACYGYIFMTGKKLYSTIENSNIAFIDNGHTITNKTELTQKILNTMSIISGLTGINAGGLKNLNLSSYKNTIKENDDLDDFMTPRRLLLL